ncbi:synaptotagmin-7-like protein [Leptotrombidium deliense]|uniref:Synaptotagmin-7-like protein n=1 Tax=Leptotrombidium deliense TaxID=299467 RepID=A0A443SBG2_9ACAR|nr:synaptotagmin-7-like protein [Leptotrombidium deliense]
MKFASEMIEVILAVVKLKKIYRNNEDQTFFRSHFIDSQKSPIIKTTKITSRDTYPSDEYLSNGSENSRENYVFVDFPHRELLKPADYCPLSARPRVGSDSDRLSVESSDKTDKSGSSKGEMSGHTATSEIPTITFKLTFLTSEHKLSVEVVNINNLPIQFRKHCSSYVKVSLKTFSKTKSRSHKTKTIRNSLNPNYNEEINFIGIPFDEIRNYRLRLSAMAKSKTLSKRMLVGDLYIPLSRPDFEPDTTLCCVDRLSLACPVTGKRGPVLMTGELGFLHLELEYHIEARRIKVMIRKAQQLPLTRKGTLANIGSPDFYVIVSLGCEGEVITYKETKPAAGINPIWNQPFLFYLEEDKVNSYWLQFLVMRGKLYTKDGAVGQIFIGEKTTISGKAHWNEIMKPEYVAVAKWHELSSLTSHCF